MSDKTPPAWAIKSANVLIELHNQPYDEPGEMAGVIAAHAPDAEALADALHKIGWEPIGDSEASYQQVLIDIEAIARAAYNSYRAAHPKG